MAVLTVEFCKFDRTCVFDVRDFLYTYLKKEIWDQKAHVLCRKSKKMDDCYNLKFSFSPNELVRMGLP